MLLLLSSAFAYPCMGASISGFLPPDGRTEVPTDVQPVALWTTGCLNEGTLYFELWGDEDFMGSASVDVDRDAGVLRLVPEVELMPYTEYAIYQDRWTPGTEAEPVLRFTTGEHPATGAEAPEARFADATSERTDGGWQVNSRVEAELGYDPDALSVLVILDADGEQLGGSGSSGLFHLEQAFDQRPDQNCIFVVQEDGSGTRSEPIELCGEVERGGCSTAAGGAGLLATFFGLALSRRRRS
jgi:hypothetical protein